MCGSVCKCFITPTSYHFTGTTVVKPRNQRGPGGGPLGPRGKYINIVCVCVLYLRPSSSLRRHFSIILALSRKVLSVRLNENCLNAWGRGRAHLLLKLSS